MANSTNIIGKVVAIQGQAIVKSPDGAQRQLKVGDVVTEKDVIVTASGAQVELAFDSGHSYVVRQNETVTLDASVFAPSQTEIANAALLPADASPQNVTNAVIGENSLDKLLEETAAGLGGGDAGDGNSFVRVDRIAENVTPTTLVGDVQTTPAAPPADTAAAPATQSVEVASVSGSSITEGGVNQFEVRLSGASSEAINLNLSLISGTATVGVDTTTQLVSVDGGVSFTPLNGSVIVPAGVTSVLVRVATANDGVTEGNETYSLAASTASNTNVILGQSTIVDPVTPTISLSGPGVVNESIGTVTYTVTLSAASTAAVNVNYTTVNGTAFAGSDYAAGFGTLTFAPGETSKTITVAITNDTVYEGTETLQVVLSTPNNAVLGTASATTTAINDDGTGLGGIDNDIPSVISVSSPSVAEGGNLVFTVSLSNASASTTQVSVSAASGTAILGVDTGAQEVSLDGGATWSSLTDTVGVPAGSTSFLVRVATILDGIAEGSETISLSASTNQNTAPASGIGTILDGTVPSISISGPSDVDESIGTVTYTISLSTASSAAVSVNYGTLNGTALAGSDYTSVAGSVTFAPGETSKTITVAITNDTIFEGAENYQVVLSNPTNAAIGNGVANTVIHDEIGTGNDIPRVISVSSPSVTEGGNLVFTVGLSNTSTTSTSVSVAAASGSATLGIDTEGQEYSTDGGVSWNPLTGSVTVPAGASSFQVRIGTVIDGILEGNETLTLAAATEQNTAPVVGTGTIIDGAIPTVSIAGPADVNEAIGTVTYTITLSSVSTAPVSVNYATANGTAIAGSDYAAALGTVTFAPGETSKTVTVAITNDTVFEGAENFRVVLSNPTNAALGASNVVTTIHDDGTGDGGNNSDFPTVVSVSSPSVAEGGNLVFSVGLSNASNFATTVNVNAASGSAIIGVDTGAQQYSTDGGASWNTLGSNVQVPAGATSFLVRILAIQDGIVEPNETITLSAATSQNSAAIVGTGTITEATQPTVIVVEPGEPGVGDNNVVEGNDLTYSVTLSGITTVSSTYAYSLGGGTATATSDYNTTPTFSNGVSLVGSNLIVPAGVSSFTVTVATIDDTIVDSASPESLPLVIGGVTGAGGIIDNDQPSISTVEPGAPGVGDNNVVEGNSLSYTVTLTGSTTIASTYAYSLGGGSATATSDYNTTPTFSNGVSLVGSNLIVPAGVS
ncbi:beta strand repeat-containing protein, partial [Undibacterium fentianense]